MKTKLLLTLVFVLVFSGSYWAQSRSSTSTIHNYPYVEVVVAENRIWLMPDEQPVAEIPVQIVDADGEVVVEKYFCTKTTSWSLDVSNLPAGKYKILIGNNQTEYLEKKGRRWTL